MQHDGEPLAAGAWEAGPGETIADPGDARRQSKKLAADWQPGDPECGDDDWSDSFTADTLDGRPVPARVWHVRDLIPARAVTLLSGDGGVGKSTLALQLSVATVAETRWIGQDARAGRVLYLSAEDDTDELHRRLDAITVHHQLSFERRGPRAEAAPDRAGAVAMMRDPNASRPLAPAQMARIEAAIVHARAAMECLEYALDTDWAVLRVLAEIKSTGRMSIAQRTQLADWMVRE